MFHCSIKTYIFKLEFARSINDEVIMERHFKQNYASKTKTLIPISFDDSTGTHNILHDRPM